MTTVAELRRRLLEEQRGRTSPVVNVRTGNVLTFGTNKAASAVLAGLQAKYPRNKYGLRVKPGGRFYLVCTILGNEGA